MGQRKSQQCGFIKGNQWSFFLEQVVVPSFIIRLYFYSGFITLVILQFSQRREKKNKVKNDPFFSSDFQRIAFHATHIDLRFIVCKERRRGIEVMTWFRLHTLFWSLQSQHQFPSVFGFVLHNLLCALLEFQLE